MNLLPRCQRCKLLRPIDPPIILGTGLNYHKHATECGLAVPDVPVLAFVKPPSAAQHPNLPIMIPACCDPETPEVDWEVELAIVIGGGGRPCKSVTEEAAMDFVLGYTVANDVSARLVASTPWGHDAGNPRREDPSLPPAAAGRVDAATATRIKSASTRNPTPGADSIGRTQVHKIGDKDECRLYEGVSAACKEFPLSLRCASLMLARSSAIDGVALDGREGGSR